MDNKLTLIGIITTSIFLDLLYTGSQTLECYSAQSIRSFFCSLNMKGHIICIGPLVYMMRFISVFCVSKVISSAKMNRKMPKERTQRRNLGISFGGGETCLGMGKKLYHTVSSLRSLEMSLSGFT